MTVTELAPTEQIEELRSRYRAFMEAHVYPNENALDREDDAAQRLIADLRARAKQEGLWAPHLPRKRAAPGSGSSPTRP